MARASEVWNVYGPTETAVWSAADRVAAGAPVRIGAPIANTSLVLMSPALELVPVGVPGELWIGGGGLARGYRGRPELTAERFVPDPSAGRPGAPGETAGVGVRGETAARGEPGEAGGPGARLYRTGDLARHDGRGRIEFLGRIDHQVKVRGFRIELGEVESTLESHPAVERAVATADAVGGGRLVAYVVLRRAAEPEWPGSAGVDALAYLIPGGAPAAAVLSPAEAPAGLTALIPALRAHLGRTLPDYMVPTAWVELASVPLTPNGKVDRKALPKVEEQARVYVAPRGELEELLAGIWAEVLRADRVGVHDNFFEVGGHSLMATLVMSRIGEALAIEVPLRILFEAPTIALLAERLRRDVGLGVDVDAAARLVLELLALSSDEVESLLVGQAEGASGAPAGDAA